MFSIISFLQELYDGRHILWRLLVLVFVNNKTPPIEGGIYISIWWLLPDLNWGHKALQASALPTELKSRIG